MEGKKPKITIANIISFFEGNLKMLGDKFGHIPRYQKEQVLYRAEICKDSCLPHGKCEVCGCKVPGKLYSSKSCNKGKKFPDLMQPGAWRDFKKEHNLTFEKL